MNDVQAIAAVSTTAAPAAPNAAPTAAAAPAPVDFGSMIANGLAETESKINRADAMVRAFAVDDSIPVHEVTVALEEARLSVELALQVRNRLIEGYREIMNMQL